MASDAAIYVVGFPKSGNTWLLRMLSDLCDANIDQSDIINAADFRPERKNVVHKVHFASADDLRKKGKIIYIVRDVRDVLVSGFFHNHRFISEESVLLDGRFSFKRVLLRQYFRHHLRRLNGRWRGTEITQAVYCLIRLASDFWRRLRMKGTPKRHVGINWSDHVIYWTSVPDICLVRYEDLLSDTAAQMEKILHFLHRECNREDLDRVVEEQSFEIKKQRFLQKQDLSNYLFMRRGCSGDWARFLDDALLQLIEDRNREGLRCMNYLESDGCK